MTRIVQVRVTFRDRQEVARPRPAPAAGSLQRIVQNSAFNLTAQALYALFHLAVVFILARQLGKEVFGQYYTLFALILAVQTVAEAGLGTVLTCRIVQAPERWKETTAEAAGIFVAVGLASLGLFLALGAVWAGLRGDPSILVSCAAAGVASAALQAQRFGAGVLHAFELFGYENLAKILQGLIFVGLVLLLVWREALGLSTTLTALAISQVAVAVFLLGCLQWRWRCLSWSGSLGTVRSWLAEAVPLGLGDVVRGITWQLDTLLLGLLQPAAVVGIYSVAYRPLGPLNWLPRAVLTAAFPSFARLADGDHEALQRAFAGSLRLLWIASLPLAVAICICAEPVIRLVAGEEYLEAVVPMRILIWVATLSFLSFQFRFLFAALGKTRVFIWLVVVVLAVEAGLQLALIPRWGYFGACLGTVVGELVFTAAGLAICRQLGVGRVEWRAMFAAVLAAAVMAALLIPVRGLGLVPLAGAVTLAGGIYFALCVVFGALRWPEVRWFGSLVIGPLRRGREELPCRGSL
jgi:O-antigen/teichoic acid export membrane protein